MVIDFADCGMSIASGRGDGSRCTAAAAIGTGAVA